MNTLTSWTEIPANDLSRAKKFYKQVFGMSFTDYAVPGIDYALINFNNDPEAGALVKGEGYQPSPIGVTVYINAAPDMEPYLARVRDAGGIVLMPKTFVSYEAGYIAFIIDSEGNRIGLQHM